MTRIGTELIAVTFGYRKVFLIRFWSVRTFFDIEAPQNGHFLKLERESRRYELDILVM